MNEYDCYLNLDPDESDMREYWDHEERLQSHMKEESKWQEGTANMHPEGCYHCGSIHHFSNECPNAYYELP